MTNGDLIYNNRTCDCTIDNRYSLTVRSVYPKIFDKRDNRRHKVTFDIIRTALDEEESAIGQDAHA